MAITRIAHACIRTPDLAASEAYWCGVLGLSKQFEFEKDGERFGYYLKVGEDCYLEFFRRGESEGPAAANAGHYVHLCLETDDIEGLRAQVLAAGAEATPIKKGCDQSWQFWTTAPDGARIEFHQYTAESAQKLGGVVQVDW